MLDRQRADVKHHLLAQAPAGGREFVNGYITWLKLSPRLHSTISDLSVILLDEDATVTTAHRRTEISQIKWNALGVPERPPHFSCYGNLITASFKTARFSIRPSSGTASRGCHGRGCLNHISVDPHAKAGPDHDHHAQPSIWSGSEPMCSSTRVDTDTDIRIDQRTVMVDSICLNSNEIQ